MATPIERLIDEGIWETPTGLIARVSRGSGKNRLKWVARFSKQTPIHEIQAERATALAKLIREQAAPVDRYSLTADVATYLRTADITPTTRKVRTPQLAWWCAQPAKLEGIVLSPAMVKAEAEAAQLGKQGPNRGVTLGDIQRHKLDPKRLREVLAKAFAPTNKDKDPYQFASTSNHYRTALLHLYSELDQDNPDAPKSPILSVKVRAQRGAQPNGQDARVIAEILKHLPTKYGRKTKVTELRLAVLAWVHITPKQLMQLDLPGAFHDVPDATYEETLDGLITLTKPPRLKGRKNKPLPAPETIPLNPLGIAALRAYAAEPSAWGTFSLSSANKQFKGAAKRAQAALAKRGYLVDLSKVTVYHLKHSLATVASLASAGLMDRQGNVRQSPGVQRALDHSNPRTTRVYTQASVDPIIRHVNRATALFLEALLLQPLTKTPLRLVADRQQ